jgi:hypothetical protein
MAGKERQPLGKVIYILIIDRRRMKNEKEKLQSKNV